MDKTSKRKHQKYEPLIFGGFVCFFAVITLFSGYKLASTVLRLHAENKAFEELADLVAVSEEPGLKVPDTEALATEDPDTARRAVYQALYDRNNDFYGWLSIEGTSINYPVMFTPNAPEYYLRKDFEKKYSFSGSLFMDYRYYDGCGNLIIYGHHMNNGTMFGELPNYANQDYYEAHKYISFDTIDESVTYQVMAAFYSKIYAADEDGFRYYEYCDLTSPDIFMDYAEKCLKSSVLSTGVSTTFGDEFLTLSTCSYHTEEGRFVVVAVKTAA